MHMAYTYSPPSLLLSACLMWVQTILSLTAATQLQAYIDVGRSRTDLLIITRTLIFRSQHDAASKPHAVVHVSSEAGVRLVAPPICGRLDAVLAAEGLDVVGVLQGVDLGSVRCKRENPSTHKPVRVAGESP